MIRQTRTNTHNKPSLACEALLRATRLDWQLDGVRPSSTQPMHQIEISKSPELGNFESSFASPGGIG